VKTAAGYPPAAQTEVPAAFLALKPYYIEYQKYIGIAVAIYMIFIPVVLSMKKTRRIASRVHLMPLRGLE
jgi:hypothetical protein